MTPAAHEPKDFRRRYTLELVALAVILTLLFAAWAVGRSSNPAAIGTPSAAAAPPDGRTLDQQARIDRLEASRDACAITRRVTVGLAEGIRHQFEEHAHAHHLYVQKKIPFGPVDKPGTVLHTWRLTLAERERLDPLLKQAIKQEHKACA